MSEKEFKLLEGLFSAEIAGMPFQTRAKNQIAQLQGRGMVCPWTAVLPGRFKVTIEGWQLTERGRFLYCRAHGSRTALGRLATPRTKRNPSLWRLE